VYNIVEAVMRQNCCTMNWHVLTGSDACISIDDAPPSGWVLRRKAGDPERTYLSHGCGAVAPELPNSIAALQTVFEGGVRRNQ
jgi:hypothetical protein